MLTLFPSSGSSSGISSFNIPSPHIPYEFFKVDILLWFIIFLLIALIPFMFALFSGVWGFLTYLCGFLSGYVIIGGLFYTADFLYLMAGILCLGLGILSALYGEFIKG